MDWEEAQGENPVGVFPLVRPGTEKELNYVCSDMCRPYLKVIKKKARQAIHILDRFHIMTYLGKAIDEVSAGEAKELKEKGNEPALTRSRWLLLKRPENLTRHQETKLSELLQYNLRLIRSYLLKEEFQFSWKLYSFRMAVVAAKNHSGAD